MAVTSLQKFALVGWLAGWTIPAPGGGAINQGDKQQFMGGVQTPLYASASTPVATPQNLALAGWLQSWSMPAGGDAIAQGDQQQFMYGLQSPAYASAAGATGGRKPIGISESPAEGPATRLLAHRLPDGRLVPFVRTDAQGRKRPVGDGCRDECCGTPNICTEYYLATPCSLSLTGQICPFPEPPPDVWVCTLARCRGTGDLVVPGTVIIVDGICYEVTSDTGDLPGPLDIPGTIPSVAVGVKPDGSPDFVDCLPDGCADPRCSIDDLFYVFDPCDSALPETWVCIGAQREPYGEPLPPGALGGVVQALSSYTPCFCVRLGRGTPPAGAIVRTTTGLRDFGGVFQTCCLCGCTPVEVSGLCAGDPPVETQTCCDPVNVESVDYSYSAHQYTPTLNPDGTVLNSVEVFITVSGAGPPGTSLDVVQRVIIIDNRPGGINSDTSEVIGNVLIPACPPLQFFEGIGGQVLVKCCEQRSGIDLGPCSATCGQTFTPTSMSVSGEYRCSDGFFATLATSMSITAYSNLDTTCSNEPCPGGFRPLFQPAPIPDLGSGLGGFL